MIYSLLEKGQSVINRLFVLSCTLLFIALVYHHFQLITYAIPLDYLEAIMPYQTSVYAAGESPYSLESQPFRNYGYTPLSNIIVAPLTFVFGNTLQLHRAVVAVFLLASCAMLYFLARGEGAAPRNGFAAAVLVYAGFLYYSTPISGPNGVGLFLFLSCIVVSRLANFSNRSLVVCLVLGVLAFWAKQYFVACLGFVALYLFLAVSKKKALIFGAAAALTFGASVILVHYTSPYFLDNTVFSSRGVMKLFSSNKLVLQQFVDFGELYLPVLVALLVLAIQALWRMSQRVSGPVVERRVARAHTFLNLTDMNEPLLRWKPDYVWLFFVCSLVIFAISLGKNPGNNLTYIFQLILPFLAVGILILVSRAGRLQWLCQLLLILAFYNSYFMLSHDFSVDQKNWDRLKQVMSEGENIYATPIVLGELVASGKPVYANGTTRYFPFAQYKPEFLVKTEPQETVGQIWQKYVNSINAKIENQEFDLLLLEQWNPLPEHWELMRDAPLLDAGRARAAKRLLGRYYRRTEVVNLSLANRPGGGEYRIEVWRPRTGSSPAEEAQH